MANVSYTTIHMTRWFEATAKQVFDAWVNPDQMYKWLFTTNQQYEGRVVDNVARYGGMWSIKENRNGEFYEACGQYLDVSSPLRLVFTFQMPQFSETVDRITVEIEPIEKGCKLFFTQHIVVPLEEEWTSEVIENTIDKYSSQTEQGWANMFEVLKQIVES
jgi:uncharacterized protein YndB with AHSA1/START domain